MTLHLAMKVSFVLYMCEFAGDFIDKFLMKRVKKYQKTFSFGLKSNIIKKYRNMNEDVIILYISHYFVQLIQFLLMIAVIDPR